MWNNKYFMQTLFYFTGMSIKFIVLAGRISYIISYHEFKFIHDFSTFVKY